MSDDSVFKDLYQIDIADLVQQMPGFGGRTIDYLEWATVWRLIKEYDADARFTIYENPSGLPFFTSDYGMFVKVSLEVKGKTELEWYAVEPAEHVDLGTPEISNAHQRALVKCAGRHGLGLKLWERAEREKIASRRGESHTPPPNQEILHSKNAGPGAISEAQAKRLYAIAKGKGWTDAGIKGIVGAHGYSSSKDIKKSDYEKIVKILENKPAPSEDVPF